MSKITIRPTKSSNWQILQDLNHQSMSANVKYDTLINPNWEYTDFGKEYFQKRCSDKTYFTVIAELNNKPIGYLNGKEEFLGYRVGDGQRVGVIENIGVIPQYQSQGVGQKLIEEFRTWCKKQGITQIYVNSFIKNQPATDFYTKLGFKPLDIAFEKKV